MLLGLLQSIMHDADVTLLEYTRSRNFRICLIN
jgi:hypothetical protein